MIDNLHELIKDGLIAKLRCSTDLIAALVIRDENGNIVPRTEGDGIFDEDSFNLSRDKLPALIVHLGMATQTNRSMYHYRIVLRVIDRYSYKQIHQIIDTSREVLRDNTFNINSTRYAILGIHIADLGDANYSKEAHLQYEMDAYTIGVFDFQPNVPIPM